MWLAFVYYFFNFIDDYFLPLCLHLSFPDNFIFLFNYPYPVHWYMRVFFILVKNRPRTNVRNLFRFLSTFKNALHFWWVRGVFLSVENPAKIFNTQRNAMHFLCPRNLFCKFIREPEICFGKFLSSCSEIALLLRAEARRLWVAISDISITINVPSVFLISVNRISILVFSTLSQ